MPKLAIRGGRPVFPSGHAWPAWPVVNKKDERRVLAAVRDLNWGIDAAGTADFAERFASYTGMAHVLPVNSGTAALELAVKALDIGPGDEVIVPAYTFIATATCALEMGATVVFADIDPRTCNLDLEDVARRLTPRTRAIIPVHFAGNPVDMRALRRLTRGKGIALIEDAAHAHGMLLRGRSAGHGSAAAAYSFQTSKNMTSGEGGALVTTSRRVYEACWSCHSFGRKPGHAWYEHHYLSWNHRLTALQCALLLGQLERLERQTLTRHRNGAVLNDAIARIPGQSPQITPDAHAETRRAYHLYIWRHDAAATGLSRDRFVEALQAEGLDCSGGYPAPLPEAPMFRDRRFWHSHRLRRPHKGVAEGEPDYRAVEMPGTTTLCRQAVWLPHPVLLAPRRDMQLIVDAIGKVLTHADELR